MALIGTLRNKMTKFVVGFVAIAMAAFIVGSDLFTGTTGSIFGNDNSVGEIAGSSVSVEEYQAVIQEMENNFAMQMGRRPGENEMPTIRAQAWELLIARKAIVPQYTKVGIKVHGDEVYDMVQGKYIDEGLKNSFRDSMGRFDRSRLIMTLQDIARRPANDPSRVQWEIFKSSLAPGRERLKYENLILKTNYVTMAEAEHDYHTQNDVAEVKYLYVPFHALSDTLVTVSESELKDYYNRHKEKYQTEQTRSLSYVTFPVVPTPEDSAQALQNLKDIVNDFKATTDDSLFALSKSANENAFMTYNVSNLPDNISRKLDVLIPGTVIGPFQEGGSFKLMKMVKIAKDTNYFARASHILITWEDSSDGAKKKAREKARKILAELKAGDNFALKARDNSDDPNSARVGGDVDWFYKGKMVKPFESAVFNARKTGLLPDLIETDYGYHIIEVTKLKNSTTYSVASIEELIAPSDKTENDAAIRADIFANGISGVEEFKEKAKKEDLAVFDAPDLSPADRNINNLPDARVLVSWVFRDGEIGKVSEVYDLEDNYVVAIMTGETVKGYKPFEKVKDVVTPLAKNEIKSKMIIEKLNGQTGELEELAKLFDGEAFVNSASDLKLNTNSMTSVGYDPLAVGKAFALESNKRSTPFVGENGVLVIEMKNKTIAPSIGDYSMFKNQLVQSRNSRTTYTIAEALKEVAKIEDRRYKVH